MASFPSIAVFPDDVLSDGSSIMLMPVLGRLLLCGLFWPLVNIGVGALELISMGIEGPVGAVTEDGVIYGGAGPVKISFSMAAICLP